MNNKRKYDELILKLRAEGKLMREIAEIAGCSMTTVQSALDPESREKRKKRNKKWRALNPIDSKCHNFNDRDTSGEISPEQVLKKFGNNPHCALTGTPIKWEDINSYSLDHIIPVARGGTSTIDNCQVLLSEVNQMKNQLMKDELFALCSKILTHAGYTVYPPVEGGK